MKTRAELMALTDDALMAEHLVPSGKRGAKKKGKQALLAIAPSTHEMLARHPWALVAMRGAPPGPNALLHTEQCLDALFDTSLSDKEKLTLLAMVDDLVFGHALREAEARVQVDEVFAKAMLETGRFPRLEQTFRRGPIAVDARRLERGLEAILASFLPG